MHLTRGCRWLAPALLAAALAGCGGDDVDERVSVVAVIDGRLVDDATSRDPLRIDPTAESTLTVTATNLSDDPVTIHRVRLEGEMLGLDFLAYDVRTGVELAPGEERTIDVPLDFFDLERQANGFLRAYIRTYDGEGTRLSSNGFALDIDGSTTSTMNLFALVLLLLTAASTAVNVRDMRTSRLPSNRFVRGLRFLVPGLGLGLLLSVAFSILRVLPLPATSWVPLTLLPAIGGFAIGYFLTPGADGPDDDDDDDDDDLEYFVGAPLGAPLDAPRDPWGDVPESVSPLPPPSLA